MPATNSWKVERLDAGGWQLVMASGQELLAVMAFGKAGFLEPGAQFRLLDPSGRVDASSGGPAAPEPRLGAGNFSGAGSLTPFRKDGVR